MRVVEIHQGSQTRTGRSCDAEGCLNYTRSGKPFCPDHVDRNLHAGIVIRDIAQREQEDARVAQGKPVSSYNIHGITAQAILQDLEVNTTRTRARLCRELVLPEDVLAGYARALIRAKLVTGGKNQRGKLTLTLRQ